MNEAKVIAICIGKGGQLKTTTTCNMAYILNSFGHKTLVIDCDPQCNASLLFGAQIKDAYTLYDCFIETRHPADPNECIQHTDKGDIIAGDSLISEITSKVYDGSLKLTDLRTKVLDKIKTSYEYILIDCPPDLTGFINRSVIASSDELLATLKGDRLSVKGLADISKVITSVKETLNPGIKINGMLLIDFKGNTKNGQNALRNAEHIAAQLNTTLYDSKIRLCAKGQEAIDKADFVTRYAPSCTSSRDYYYFVDEFIQKESKNG